MITAVEIYNFKRLRAAVVPLRALNVLTGLNGTGKSTFIHALLLAKQAAPLGATGIVSLNDVYGLALGEAQDALHPLSETQQLTVRIWAAERSVDFQFEIPSERSLNLPFGVASDVQPPECLTTESGRMFAYLNAERLGPRDQLAMTATDVADMGVGERGQYTAQVLASHESDRMDELSGMIHPDTDSEENQGVRTLRTQVELWASDIIRPIEITAEWRPGLSATTMRFREPGLGLIGSEVRPGNTGFGISYALPIIVAGLRMQPRGLFIVENPEAHLHPQGQSRIGAFLAQLAANDVQVIIETHSDHVLNGVRLAVADGLVSNSDVLVHHYQTNPTDPGPVAIEMSARGTITSWPDGFFDQLERDLGRLSRARRETN